MTFKDYLAGLKAGHDAKGDFVRLARADTEMPDIATMDEFASYIERRRDYQAVEAWRAVWADYEVKQREAARHAKKA